MELESERMLLKEIGWEDTPDIHRLHSLPEVDAYNTLGLPESIAETKAVMEPLIMAQQSANRKLYYWKVILKAKGKFIGIAGMNLSLDKFKSGELYYKLLPDSWGNGYATELAQLLIKSGFETFKLHRIEAGVATENTASIRVLEKAGMTREGRHRKILPIRGAWKDNYHYAIVEGDPAT